MINNITFSHFEGLHKQGYSLDVVFLLTLAKQGVDVKSLCEGSPKLEVLFQGVFRKGLITDQCKLTLSGQSVLDFLQQEISETTPLKKKTNIDSEFERWWKAYPGTDTFVHKGKTFQGTRSMRVKKDDCKIKLKKILDEGEYTIDEMLEALEYEVLQKKENSVKAGENKLKYMQNTLTYLNQRTFEPYIELIKEGVSAPTEEHSVPSGSVDI
jgi:hypothetical protein